MLSPTALDSQRLSSSEASPPESWRLDEFVADPGYLAYREELRCLIFNKAQTAAPTREGTPEAADGDFAAPGTISGDEGARGPDPADGPEARLDMFDSDRAFRDPGPRPRARGSPALLYAVLALSARQMERKGGKQTASFDSLELYQEAIRLLTARDWRRHLEGCAALFDSFCVHGFSGGLPQAVFWCYARMAATLLTPSKPASSWPTGRGTELGGGAGGRDSPEELADRWARLWDGVHASPGQQQQQRQLGVAGSVVWHAKRICGISLANPHRGCLNNAIQPLWIAGRLLSHRSEHALLVRLIRGIEAVTGWGTCWRIDDLEAAWGYKARKDPKTAGIIIAG
ncbi:hypothetical protein LY76DRAFT_620092 [Colletotrichum caudatum]|nr:hypothetical protein LY76DRAFT_620092 [Colletotrichum caudatum]